MLPPNTSVIRIAILKKDSTVVSALAELLIETVANGGSVSFMHPLTPELARVFWEDSLAAAERAERIVFGAYDDNALIGTVTLVFIQAPNQPHRAEVAKLMTRMNRRGQGIARKLMQTAEQMAIERGRTLLTLDTAVIDGAAELYEKLGYVRAGVIPDFALKPLGGLTGTAYYYKRIGAAAQTK